MLSTVHRSLRPLVFLSAVGLFLACATTGVNRGDLNLLSIEDEWELGRRLEADLAEQLTLVSDPVVAGYLDQMGRRIVRQTEMASLPWKFHVVRDDQVNAFNIPGGHVYVNSGLIVAADNAAELAGVVAHEIGHGVARHGTEQLTTAYGLSLLAGAVLGDEPRTYERILAQIVGTGAIARFSREDEREADALGLRYLYDAGYDPRGMVGIFEELLRRSRRDRSSVERFFATHPLTEERIRDTEARIAELPPRPDLVQDEPGFRRARNRLR